MVASNGLNALIVVGGFSGHGGDTKEILDLIKIKSGELRMGELPSEFASQCREIWYRSEDGLEPRLALEDFLRDNCEPLMKVSRCKPLDGRVVMNHWTVGWQNGDIGCQGQIAGGGSGGVYQVLQFKALC